MQNKNENTEFYDEVLIKLHRKYGKDELVSSLTKKISDKDIEIGQLKSYIDELHDKYKIYKENSLIHPNNFVDDKDFTHIKTTELERIKLEIKNKTRQITELRTSNRELITKLLKTENNGKQKSNKSHQGNPEA